MSATAFLTRLLRRTALAAAALLFVTASAHAQSCDLPNGNNKDCTTLAVNITMAVINATRLTVTTNALSLPNNDVKASDYTAGFKAAGTITLTAKANAAATISMTASTTPSGFSGLEWAPDGVTFSSPATLLTLPAASGGTPKTVTFRTKLSWAADAPGTYTQTLNFTIASP